MKQCPHCGDTRLVCMRSQFKKQCSGCGEWLPWELKEGQLPLVDNNRASRRRKK